MTTGSPHPTPVFVLGLQRSGTTWLANLLAGHPRVVAVQSADHYGIHESIFFSHFARAYGDLGDDVNFERFARDFTTSDYYVLTELEPEWLWRRRPRSYAEAFRAVMDELARRRGGAALWLEKSPHHTLLAESLAADFPDALFVCISRKPVAVITSRLWSERQPPAYPSRLIALVRGSWTCSLYQRWLRRFCAANPRCIATTYEALAADPAGQGARICSFLGIDFQPEMLSQRWTKNTSFRTQGDRRKRSPRALEAAIIAVASALARLVPLDLMARMTARLHRRVEWPEWCWRRRDAGLLAERRAAEPDPPAARHESVPSSLH